MILRATEVQNYSGLCPPSIYSHMIPSKEPLQDESLKRSVSDGSYFIEARRWYDVAYMSLISERLLYIIYSILSLIIMALALKGVVGLLPIKPGAPLVMMTRNVIKEYPTIVPLGDVEENPDHVIRRFFITQYVLRRERYDKDLIADSARFVLNYSSPDVYGEYRQFYDKSNPRSPILRYESRARRLIEIGDISIRLTGDKASAGETAQYDARVAFRAIVADETRAKTSYWTAELRFEYQDIQVVKNDDPDSKRALKVIPMKFRVLDYKSNDI